MKQVKLFFELIFLIESNKFFEIFEISYLLWVKSAFLKLVKYDIWIAWEKFFKMSEICFSYTWYIFGCEIRETCYFRISKRVKSVFHTNYNPFRTEIWKWVKYVFSIKWNYFSEMSDISFFIWVTSFFNIVKWNQFYEICVASSLKQMKYVFSNMWNWCLNLVKFIFLHDRNTFLKWVKLFL